MANKTPVKAIFSGSDVTSLGEFASGDTIAISYIADGTITNAKITNATIAGGKLQNDTITGTQIAANSIGSSELSDNAVDTDAVADDAITAAKLANSINTDIATGPAALPKAGGAMTGAITTNSTFDGVDIATRDAILTSTTTTAGAALPKAGGTMTGTLVAKVATTATWTDTNVSGNATWNFDNYQNFVITLTGNTTFVNPSTENVGQSGFFAIIQDGTGSRTVSLGTDWETAAAAGLTLTATASATDLVPYLVVAANRILLGTPQLAFA